MASPATCPACGGALCWQQGGSRGYVHEDGCKAMDEGIPVRLQVGDGELAELGRFLLENGETTADGLINFLHATAMMMLSKTGRSPAAHCMEPAIKAARAGN